jgi:hypothetical protein
MGSPKPHTVDAESIQVKAFYCPSRFEAANQMRFQVDSNDSVSQFMGGVFFGAFVTAVIVLLLGYAGTFVPLIARLHSYQQILISAVIAVVVLITRPVLLKTVWSERRDPFLLDQDVVAMIQGRLLGIVFGIIVAILIQNYVI